MARGTIADKIPGGNSYDNYNDQSQGITLWLDANAAMEQDRLQRILNVPGVRAREN